MAKHSHWPYNGIQRLRIPAISAALAVALILTGFTVPGGLMLSVVPVRQDTPLAVLWMTPGETFTIRYFHSVEHSPIWETHSIDAAGRIFIEEERYLKFGAGMGKMPNVGRMVQRGPYEIIEAMHMPTGNFVLRIGSPGVDHTLIYDDRQINLTDLAPHTAVQFSARPVTAIYRIWRHWFPDSGVEARIHAP